MADWGTSNNASDAPKFLSHMKAAGYGNTVGSDVVSLNAAQAANTGGDASPGWVYIRQGAGPVVGLTIVAGGTGYSNTDTWSRTGSANGGTVANGTITTDAAGVIKTATITNPGSGMRAQNANVTINTTAGTGGQITAVIGGRGGRITREVLVVSPSQQ